VLWVTAHPSNVSQNRSMKKPPQRKINPKTKPEIGPTMGASTRKKRNSSEMDQDTGSRPYYDAGLQHSQPCCKFYG
jgi:hypothetical protein